MQIVRLYFAPEEFACPCCGVTNIAVELLEILNAIRILADEPVIITSGYRCKKHNAEVGGTPNSAHLKGLAADITLKSGDFNKLANLCFNIAMMYNKINWVVNLGFNRRKNFVHIDVEWRGYYRLWTYYKDYIKYDMMNKIKVMNAMTISNNTLYKLTSKRRSKNNDFMRYLYKEWENKWFSYAELLKNQKNIKKFQ